jgi:peptidoglycan hydrolase-like protein with peptidoglycan-binding domain
LFTERDANWGRSGYRHKLWRQTLPFFRKGSPMRTFTLPLILVASFGLSTPVLGQDLGDVIGGIAQSLINKEVDRSAYVAAQNANTVSAYRDYLANFKNGQYRANAENALARLGTPVEGSPASAAQAEAKLSISAAQRASVQRELTRLGYRTYGADGVWGRNTRSAISSWQRDRGDTVTGYVTGEQLRLLARVTAVTPPAENPSPGDLTAPQVEARLGITAAQRVSVQRELTLLGHRTYGTDGIWGRNTRSAISSWQRDRGDKVTGYVTGEQLRLLSRGTAVAPPTQDPPSDSLTAAQTEATLRLTRTQRITIQRQLTAIGYDAGVADGLWGSRTRAAISAWQRANRGAQTGYVTESQVKLIASQAGTAATAPDDGASGPALEESLLELTRAERGDLQRRLGRLGYNSLPTDGIFSSETRRAIAEWQADKGETATGYLTADQVRLIRVETGG